MQLEGVKKIMRRTVEEKKNMYVVLKVSDVKTYLSSEDCRILDGFLAKIEKGREAAGKNPYNEYYVCNVDEPYAADVHNTIISGEIAKGNEVSYGVCEKVFEEGESLNEKAYKAIKAGRDKDIDRTVWVFAKDRDRINDLVKTNSGRGNWRMAQALLVEEMINAYFRKYR